VNKTIVRFWALIGAFQLAIGIWRLFHG